MSRGSVREEKIAEIKMWENSGEIQSCRSHVSLGVKLQNRDRNAGQKLDKNLTKMELKLDPKLDQYWVDFGLKLDRDWTKTGSKLGYILN